tara:strand:- start:349 stop:933 length:585 start_codon:yes stop_codon:yes gene_type:complete
MNFKTTAIKMRKVTSISDGAQQEAEPEIYEVSRAMGILDEPEASEVSSENVDLQTVLFFEKLGCSILEDYDRDATLLDDNVDEISNPNIQQPQITKNRKLGTLKSFTNESDPFYDTGKRKPESTTNKISVDKTAAKGKKSKTLMTDLTNINIDKTNSVGTLRQISTEDDTTSSGLTKSTISDNVQTTIQTFSRY